MGAYRFRYDTSNNVAGTQQTISLYLLQLATSTPPISLPTFWTTALLWKYWNCGKSCKNEEYRESQENLIELCVSTLSLVRTSRMMKHRIRNPPARAREATILVKYFEPRRVCHHQVYLQEHFGKFSTLVFVDGALLSLSVVESFEKFSNIFDVPDRNHPDRWTR